MAAARRRPPQPVHELCPPRLPPSSGGPLILLVERQRSPHEALCQLTVVSCDPEALAHHEAAATPPKIRGERRPFVPPAPLLSGFGAGRGTETAGPLHAEAAPDRTSDAEDTELSRSNGT